MAFTQRQARDKYIIDSIGAFLKRNVKVGYDAEAAATAGKVEVYTQPLRIMRGQPDDASNKLTVPAIAIDWIESTERDSVDEIGSSMKWRHRNFVLYCYPATTDVTGLPSTNAADLLRSHLMDALGTEYIKVIDYENLAASNWTSATDSNIVYLPDLIQLANVTDPMPRGTKDSLPIERHRFDVHLNVRYPVMETLNT